MKTMTDSKDFLVNFTELMKMEIGKAPIGLYHALDSFSYSEPYHFEEEMKRLEELKTVSDKILSIVYNPHIKVETNEIIQRSELAGKLSHDSFSDTMRDPKLWKEKNGKMVPEYVHTVETIDSIDTYENRFISLLIYEINDDIEATLDNLTPMVESLEEHYQNNQFTFGSYSPMRDMRKKVYPYASFFLKGKGSKEELLCLARKIKRRSKNLKGTEFYKVTSKHPISHAVMPTNILIHDKLYSYCYKYYVTHYKKEDLEERKKQILYFNYVFSSLLLAMKKREMINEKNLPIFSFDEENMITFSPFYATHYPFIFKIEEDRKNIAIKLSVTISFDERQMESSFYLLTREKYCEKNLTLIHNIKNEVENESKFILVVENNLIKDYDSTLTFSYHREHNEMLLDDLLSSVTILFEADKELYSGFCPVCGKNHIRFDGNRYVCQDCHSEYVMDKIDNKTLLWITSFRKE